MDDTTKALNAIRGERERQEVIYGQQDHPDGTGDPHSLSTAKIARAFYRAARQGGTLTWKHIFREEVYEALAETDPVALEAELVQVGAICVNWIECLHRRNALPPTVEDELTKLPG